jgi:nucleotide-binding universal stress UspA family protein
MKLEKIMVPLDGSFLAEAALAPAMEMAKVSGARLFLPPEAQRLAEAVVSRVARERNG